MDSCSVLLPKLRQVVKLVAISVLSVSLNSCLDIWIQPPRSQANIEALQRVQLDSYVFEEAGGIEMSYGLFVPTTYRSDHPTPLLVALHGNGGDEMYMMEYNNLVELAEIYGYIVVTPIGFSRTGWFGSTPINGFAVTATDKSLEEEAIRFLSETDVMNVLDEVRDQYTIDDRRIYLIGQSMGGGGTWYLGTKYPDIWAAIAPLSPVTGESPAILESATDIPVLVVAGDNDIEVDIKVTRNWVAKMTELEMQFEYLEIEGGSHSGSGRGNIDKVFEFLDAHMKE